MSDIFKDKAFDVEHALSMYAKSYVTLPAFAIYDDKIIAQFHEQISHCHIYILGLLPVMKPGSVAQEAQELVTTFEISGKHYDLRWPLLEGHFLKGNQSDGWYVENGKDEKFYPSTERIAQRLSAEHNAINLKVLYIGQAFGKNGERNALDRLKKHETLQMIALKGVPEDYQLSVLMLAIEGNSQIFTVMNPSAKDNSQGYQRIKNGLDKMYGTSEAERTTLYEASLIRYFQPEFNKEFKNSFPSTNMKLLRDCYNKDFSALVAEIVIDELPFRLFSDAVPPQSYHIAKHDLHTDKSRQVFFS